MPLWSVREHRQLLRSEKGLSQPEDALLKAQPVERWSPWVFRRFHSVQDLLAATRKQD